MDWALPAVLLVLFQPSLSVLFTVQAERAAYDAQFGGEVVMGCRFQPKPLDPQDGLKVAWHRLAGPSAQEVYWMDNGKHRSASPDYQGRVKLLSEELKDGWAKLQVSRLRINDSGTYQCLVQTEKGADYKTITLSVAAPYRSVTKVIQRAEEGDEVLLSCRSEGYPRSSVTWQDGHRRRLDASASVAPTPEQLFEVSSQIRVPSSLRNNYTCSFTSGGHAATFQIPDDIPVSPVKNDSLIIVPSVGVMLLIIVVAVVTYRRRKGSSAPSARTLLIDRQGPSASAAVCYREENLGAFLKARYSDVSLSEEVRRRCDAFGLEELPHKLQNNAGRPVGPQVLLPEAGEMLFLEGPPGSGKTTVAHILVSSWTEGPAHALSGVLDLSILGLLLSVDCSHVKGDLFQEITAQLSLPEETWTEDKLRTVLTGSSEALLLLDGYREGNPAFDESVRRFLKDRGGCRVLVLACGGHCPSLRDTVGTGGLLKLQKL
ncbi:programmed cell death 1 ligand 1 isoform X2 [Pempheris klunzingeri]|uniref:programmed cell death 1 ligand 1 isoform X2 n=1 Tax=Pempheris klunzingeri TaxID=3127111 RepID=UPI00397F8758